MKKFRIIFELLIFLLAIIGLYSIFVSTYDSIDSKTNTTTTNIKQIEPQIIEITMTAETWKFTPNVIKVNKGDTVILTIKSIDVEHGFTIPAYNINENLKPNKVIKIKFVADKVGVFTFACSIYCGKGHTHMNGRLIVKG